MEVYVRIIELYSFECLRGTLTLNTYPSSTFHFVFTGRAHCSTGKSYYCNLFTYVIYLFNDYSQCIILNVFLEKAFFFAQSLKIDQMLLFMSTILNDFFWLYMYSFSSP